MPKKEDACSMAIGTALKQNATGRKSSWEEIKKNLPKSGGVQYSMGKAEKGMAGIAVANQKENIKESIEDEGEEIKKNMEAFMAAWKSGKVWTGKDSK